MHYDKWHHGGVLCEVPKLVLLELETFFENFTKRQPDQLGDTYNQWYVQNSKVDHQVDVSFIHWQDENYLKNTKLFFKKYVFHICRFRLSLLNGGSDIEFHTKHQLPRIHIPLNDCVSKMVIKNDDGVENVIPLVYGNAYYTNVTKLHKVIGDPNDIRKNAFFCFTDFIDKNCKALYIN